MLRKKKSLSSILLSLIMTASALLFNTVPAQANLTVPAEAFLPCSISEVNYCIESVSVIPVGARATSLNWVGSGGDIPGSWSARGAFTGENYDGIYLDVKPANQFVPWIFAEAKPTQGSRIATGSGGYPVDLNPDVAISFKLRVADFEVGVTFGVGTDGTVTAESGSSYKTLEFTGYPVKVPLAKSTRDCSGDSGVASALVSQLNTIFVPKNDTRGYGIEGSTGKLYVGSNGICKLSTPTWIAATKTFSYKASGPKLSPDGKEVNTGFYFASIPFADAKALWGLENPKDAVSALVVSIRTIAGGSSGAVKSVSVKGEHILISVSGFEFPDPSVDVSLNPDFNTKGAVSGSNNTPGGITGNNNMSLAGGGVKESKSKTITCVKGKKTRTVTGVKPKCPKGFTLKK